MKIVKFKNFRVYIKYAELQNLKTLFFISIITSKNLSFVNFRIFVSVFYKIAEFLELASLRISEL